MKFSVVGLVVFLLMTSFNRPTNTIVLDIDGDPNCLENKQTYMVRVLVPGELSDSESMVLSGTGIALSSVGDNSYRGKVLSSKDEIVLMVSIRNNKSNRSEHVLTRKLSVCN